MASYTTSVGMSGAGIPTSAGPKDPGGLPEYGSLGAGVALDPFNNRIVGIGWASGPAVIEIGGDLPQDYIFGLQVVGTPSDPNKPLVTRPQIGAPGSLQSDPAGYPSFFSTKPPTFWEAAIPATPLADFTKFYAFFELGSCSESGTEVGFVDAHGNDSMVAVVNIPKLVADFALKSLKINVYLYPNPILYAFSQISFGYTLYGGGKLSLSGTGSSAPVVASSGTARDSQGFTLTTAASGLVGSFTYPPTPPPGP